MILRHEHYLDIFFAQFLLDETFSQCLLICLASIYVFGRFPENKKHNLDISRHFNKHTHFKKFVLCYILLSSYKLATVRIV